MKRSFLFSILLAALSVSAAEQTSGLTILFTNQEKVSFTFASKPEIAVTTEGITVSSTTSEPVSYAFADVQRFYFEDDETSIKNISDDLSSQHPVFSYANSVVVVSGLFVDECVQVSTLTGGTVIIVKANNEGNAFIDLKDIPVGVYVISTGSGVSFKLLKK